MGFSNIVQVGTLRYWSANSLKFLAKHGHSKSYAGKITFTLQAIASCSASLWDAFVALFKAELRAEANTDGLRRLKSRCLGHIWE